MVKPTEDSSRPDPWARINDEAAKKVVENIMSNRVKVIEDWCAAYVAETGLMPSQVRLVQFAGPLGEIILRFEPL